jgi:hypothetical protein
MDWFRVAEQPTNSSPLPAEVEQARSLWEADAKENSEKILELMSPFIGGRFVADNLAGWEDYLRQDTFGEFEASTVRMAGVDFTSAPIPLCKAEGWFDLPLKEGVSRSDFEHWLNENHEGELYGAICFYWNFDAPELEHLDLTFGDHQGAEGVILEDTDRDDSYGNDDTSDADAVSGTLGVDEFKINAGWERSGDGAICRWIIVWQELPEGQLAGAIGGYSGGGSFQVEQFYAKHLNGKLTNLFIDLEDKITGAAIEYWVDVPSDISQISDDAQDVIFEWNDRDEWEDSDQLILLEGKRRALREERDMLLLGLDYTSFAKDILASIGITAAPVDGGGKGMT